MDYGKPSPFEVWRRENMMQMAVPSDIMELIAKAFEGGINAQPSWDTQFKEITDGLRKSRGLIAHNEALTMEQRQEINGPLLETQLFLKAIERVFENATKE